MPFCIGLTGGIGSGKSTVAELFRRLGAGIIDTDSISHELTLPGAPGHNAIVSVFGPEYLHDDGSLNRARLRAEIFAHPATKAKLESILHPMIRQRVQEELAECGAPYVILVVPLLIETGAYANLVQRILVVDCPEEEQVARTMARSGLSAADVHAIMANQVKRQARLAAAQDIIHNEANQAALEAQVAELDQRYRLLASEGA